MNLRRVFSSRLFPWIIRPILRRGFHLLLPQLSTPEAGNSIAVGNLALVGSLQCHGLYVIAG